jgi:alginate O-acetyltransferase complex protein AlgI
VIENIGVLLYFKYSTFFVQGANQALSIAGLRPIIWGQVLLPLGISFITFHKISYLADVYSRKAEPAETFVDYATYLALFPKLIQGPIIRYQNIAKELRNHDHDIKDTLDGLFRFSVGLAKKVLIADVLGESVDKIFRLDFASLNSFHAWLGIVCYTFQIYFDFSGYSDMGIGLAQMLGFRFQENFNRPYLSHNFTEFWRRWHITLSAWFKEYLYIPLGGNRVSRGRNYLNLWIVFVVCGLWHGANWTFIIWGIYHGCFLVADKMFLIKVSKKWGNIVNTCLTFFLVMIGWVFFRSENIGFALNYLRSLFLFTSGNPALSNVPTVELITNRGIFVMIVAALISFCPDSVVSAVRGKAFAQWSKPGMLWVKMGVLALFFVLSFATLTNNGFRPFIYFRF